MNMAAMHSYKAVPFMLTVAPSGSTKAVYLLGTPPRTSRLPMVTGNVAEDEEVENAVSRAGATALNSRIGLRIATSRTKAGSVRKKWIASATSTVTLKVTNGPAASKPVLATTAATSAKMP